MELMDVSKTENPMHTPDSDLERTPVTVSLYSQWLTTIMANNSPVSCSSNIRFMRDWAVAWNDLCECQPNEMSRLNPLLYLCLFIAYHKNTFYFNLILTAYVVFIHVISSIVYPGGGFVDLFVAVIGAVITLYLGTYVIKGSWQVESIAEKRFKSTDWGDVESNDPVRSYSLDKNDSVMRSLFARGLPSTAAALRAFIQLSIAHWNEPKCPSSGQAKQLSLRVRRDGQLTCGGYYYVAELMWKYLIDTTITSEKVLYYQVDVQQMSNKKIEVEEGVTPPPTALRDHKEVWRSSPNANRVMYFGLCFAVVYFLFVICNAWSNMASFCPEIDHSSMYCRRQRLLVFLTLGFTLDGLQAACMMFNFFTLLAVFLSATEITTALANSFILRYSPLRVLTVEDIDGTDTEVREVKRQAILKDAEERYLFLRHYQRTASFLWDIYVSTVAVLSVLIAVLSFISQQYLIQNYGYIDPNLFLYFFLSCSLELFFLATLAEANTVGNKITAMFLNAGPGDFSLIGGREKWITYISSAPVEWRVLGFLFTWTWVGTLAVTVVTSLCGMFASSLFPWI